MGRGDTEFHFSAIGQGMKGILKGEGAPETAPNHDIDGGLIIEWLLRLGKIPRRDVQVSGLLFL